VISIIFFNGELVEFSEFVLLIMNLFCKAKRELVEFLEVTYNNIIFLSFRYMIITENDVKKFLKEIEL